MTKQNITNYHEVFLPFPDVYDQGGPEALFKLERKVESSIKKGGSDKNLIVLPIEFVDELSRLENEYISAGAGEALKSISGVTSKNHSNPAPNISVTNVTGGLDLCILYDSFSFKQGGLDIDKIRSTIDSFSITTNTEKIPLKIITNDEGYHIKLSGKGHAVEHPAFLQVNEDIVFEGIIIGNADLQAALNESSNNYISLSKAEKLLQRELYINQFIRFPGQQEQFARITGTLRKDKSSTKILDVDDPHVVMISQEEHSKKLRIGNMHTDNILGIKPKDMEQYLATQYGLLNRDVSMVFMTGKAGSGKTILSYAAGIDSVLIYDKAQRELRGEDLNSKEGTYRQIILLKPPEILGGQRRNQGFLPGDLYHKLKNHLRPYIDAHKESNLKKIAFEELFRHPEYDTDFGPRRGEAANKEKINGLAHLPSNNEVIDLVYSGFIGGASVAKTLMIIDEAQDLTPYEMKTILERIAEGSKVIIAGDPKQTRNPKCTNKMNGLTTAIKHYLPKPYSTLVALPRNYRHQISDDSDDMRAYNI